MQATNSVIISTNVPFRDGFVVVTGGPDTAACGHSEIEVIHHIGPDGKHYCPTGFVMCQDCGARGIEPEPPECERWGE